MRNHEGHADIAHLLDSVELIRAHILAMDQVRPDVCFAGLLPGVLDGVERQIHGGITIRMDRGGEAKLQNLGQLLVELLLCPASALLRVGIQLVIGLLEVTRSALGGTIRPGLDILYLEEIGLVILGLWRNFVQARHGNEHPAVHTHREVATASDVFHEHGHSRGEDRQLGHRRESAIGMQPG